MQKARSATSAGRELVLEAAQTSQLAEGMGVAPTDDSGKYVWHVNPVATVKAIYTPTGFLAPGTPATPDNEVVRNHFFVILMDSCFCCCCYVMHGS